MDLEVRRNKLSITSDGTFWSDQETAYIEDTLGLRKEGDSLLLVRKNAMGLSCPAYLETQKLVENKEIKALVDEFKELYNGDLSDEAVSLLLTELEKLSLSLETDKSAEKKEDINDIAHEIWALAQLLSSEGIENGVERVKNKLLEILPKKKTI